MTRTYTLPPGVEESMAPLIAKAREEGKWLYTHQMRLWMTPDELEAEQARGRYPWGARHWEVLDPAHRRLELEHQVERAQSALRTFERRLARSKEAAQRAV